ncbi:L-glutaminase [Monaibacterium marinum]|uniref:Glutaminase n=1 Tax=Pontivivens marinum TaxID=1690039 RepID=A0A2C9CNT7_9RHOB|nr:glutaminase [Monaibacterium marinum]SOH92984.1 L-glutaminase [Monaibacterium marinum]
MDLTAILNGITDDMAARPDRGAVARYIPQLANVDPDQFAMSICLADGTQLSAGDAQVPFSIQSVSKVFSLALALGRVGDNLWTRVGREPSGQAFDSILLLEQEKGRPRNPFINAGAIVTTDTYLEGHSPAEALGGLMRFIREAADDDSIHIDEDVARSEIATGHRNFALAHYMQSHGNLRHAPELTLGTYFHQCAVAMNTDQLARAGRFLMNAPDMPRMVSDGRVRRINALMLTCGQYDGSGDFAYRVGLPGKSGVGGGILVIAPGKASIAVWSPGLNDYGNSHLGTIAVEVLARKTGWSIFG